MNELIKAALMPHVDVLAGFGHIIENRQLPKIDNPGGLCNSEYFPFCIYFSHRLTGALVKSGICLKLLSQFETAFWNCHSRSAAETRVDYQNRNLFGIW
jgi:hypothetical protein